MPSKRIVPSGTDSPSRRHGPPPTAGGDDGSGDVVGPASSTDNALARFDSTTGKLLQNSNATLSDAGAATFDDGSGNTVVITPSAASPSVTMNSNSTFYLIEATPNTVVRCRNAAASQVSLWPHNSAGAATVELANFSTTQATTLNVGSDAAGGTGSINADALTARRTNGDLNLNSNGTGEINVNDDTLVATDKKIQLRDSAIYLQSDADGELLIKADTRVKVQFPGKKIADIVRWMPPATNAAHMRMYSGGSTQNERYPVWSFDDGADEYLDVMIRVSDEYDGSSGITVRLPFSTENDLTGNNANWAIAFRRLNFGAEDTDASHTYSFQTATTAGPTTQGHIVEHTDAFTNAQADGIQPGELAIVRIFRDVSGDGIANDLYLHDLQVVLT